MRAPIAPQTGPGDGVTNPQREWDQPAWLPKPLRLVMGYALAVAAVALATGLHLALESWVGPGLPDDITFYPAVMVVALVSGFGPGVAATIAAGYFMAWWIAPAPGQLSLILPVDRIGMAIFAANGVIMSGVAELYRQDRHRAAAYDRDAALRETRQRLATFAEATFEGVIESQAGRIVDCNEQLAEMLGYTAVELKGMPIEALIAPEERDRVRTHIRLASEAMIEYTALRKDGGRITVEARGRSMSLDGMQHHSVWRDVSERKQAEETLRAARSAALNLADDAVSARRMAEVAETAMQTSEARFRSIFHHSATPMAVKLRDGRVVEVNQAYCDMLGRTEAELLDAAADAFTFPGEVSLPAEDIGRLVAGDATAVRAEKCYLHKGGQQVWCDTSVSMVSNPDGTVAYVIVQAHDITARKQAEENILKLNQQLESRVLERTAELRETVTTLEAEIVRRRHLEREILEISEREQCRLGQDLHDGLGQELAGIAMLSDVHARKLQAEGHPLAADAAKNASYIRSTIDSARRLAKGLYPIELDRYGLLLALKDLAAQTSQRAGIACGLHHTGDVPHLERSAEIHIYRIVQEAIGNAVKHARPEHIRIESVASDGMHTFAVSDDGIGFDSAGVHPGMGLHLMEYRARVIGAEIVMEHPAQGGFRIACRLPIGQPPGQLHKSPM